MTLADFQNAVKGLKNIPAEDMERILVIAEQLPDNERVALFAKVSETDAKITDALKKDTATVKSYEKFVKKEEKVLTTLQNKHSENAERANDMQSIESKFDDSASS